MNTSITIAVGGQKQEGAEQDPITAEAAARWGRDPALRAEFCNSFDTYAAFERASARGQVRVLGENAQRGR